MTKEAVCAYPLATAIGFGRLNIPNLPSVQIVLINQLVIWIEILDNLA